MHQRIDKYSCHGDIVVYFLYVMYPRKKTTTSLHKKAGLPSILIFFKAMRAPQATPHNTCVNCPLFMSTQHFKSNNQKQIQEHKAHMEYKEQKQQQNKNSNYHTVFLVGMSGMLVG